MRRNFRVLKLLAWMLFCIAQALWSLPSQAASRIVQVGIFPMGGFHDLENGRPVGYDVDYLEQVSRYTGWQVKFVSFDTWHAALSALEKTRSIFLAARCTPPNAPGVFCILHMPAASPIPPLLPQKTRLLFTKTSKNLKACA